MRGLNLARTCLVAGVLAAGAEVAAARAAGADLAGPAIVRADGTLLLQGRTVHLYGTYIPLRATFAGETCRFVVRPIRCAPRPVLALATKAEGLVRCAVVADRGAVVEAVCFVEGDSILAPDVDLGAWMIEHGWAVAAPGAPFEYVVLQEFAQAHDRGLWGFPADTIERRFVPRR